MAHISIKFFNQLVFEVPQLFLFIGRAKLLWTPTEVVVYSSQKGISIELTRRTDVKVHEKSRIEISCRELDWQVLSVAQICGHASLLLSCVERLDIRAKSPSPSGLQDLDVAQWLEHFHSFRGMKELQVNSTLGPMIESALQQAAAEATFGVFPALRRVTSANQCQSDNTVSRIMSQFRHESIRTVSRLVAIPQQGLCHTCSANLAAFEPHECYFRFCSTRTVL
jgi:hypothetical protein